MTGIEIDLREASNHLNDLAKNDPEYLIDFGEKKYKPSDIGIDARNLLNWKKNGLLPSIQKDKKWNKFDLTEAIWLKIIIELRKLNISLDRIHLIKEQLFAKINLVLLLKQHSDAREQLLKLLKDGEDLETLNELLNSPEVEPQAELEKLTALDLIIVDLIITKSKVRILFDLTGKVIVHKDHYQKELNDLEQYRNIIENTHVSISLNQMLYDLTNELIEPKHALRLQILTEKENKILEFIRGAKAKKVEITYDAQYEPQVIRITRSQQARVALKRVQELLIRGGYQDVKITTEAGRVVHVEDIMKIKL